MTLGQGQEMTLTLYTHTYTFINSNKLSAFTIVQITGRSRFRKKKRLFSLDSYRKATVTKFDFAVKVGQGQYRVIVSACYDGPKS